MLIGVLSDTNDRYDVMATAVRVLLDAGAEFFVHCGDVGNRKVLDPLAGLAAGFVWGDRDSDRMGLLRHADNLGIQCYGILGEFDASGKRYAVTHGNDTKLLKRLAKENIYDVILSGHTGKSSDTTDGTTRLISPGALDGATKSVALINAESGDVKFIAL